MSELAFADHPWGASWEEATNRDEPKPWRPLPLEVGDITAEWLTAALSSRAPGLVVNGFEITRERHGFTSVIHVRLDLNEAGLKAGIPPLIVVKGGFMPYARTYACQYATEAHGLRDIWPGLGLNMPKTYFIDIEPARFQSVIIMEDLNARGVTFTNPFEPSSYDQVKRRLTALAAVHAKTWDSPELRPGGKYADVIGNGAHTLRLHMEENGLIVPPPEGGVTRQAEFKQTPPFLSPEGWALLWKLPQNAAASVHFRDLEWNRKALLHIEKLNDELPNCLLHGDTHLSNQYEEPDGTPGFYDSMIRREPGYFELAYTITTNLDPYDRRKWERALVAHYIDELERNGVTQDFDEVYYYYSLYLHQGYLWFIINDTEWQTVNFNTVNLWRFCSAMMDNGTKELFDKAFVAAR
jgi:hypothetical protein